MANVIGDIIASQQKPVQSSINQPAKNQADHQLSSTSSKKIIWVSLLGVLVIVAGLWMAYKFMGGIQNQTEEVIEKSIAVLPFEDMSPNHDQEYFGNGMMDEILNHLFKIGDLKIISRTSTMRYRGSTLSLKEIASELGVAHILEGSVQKYGDSVRIRVQLINGKTDEQLWAETYDKNFKDIFSIQSSVAQQIASKLKITITPEVKERIESVPTVNAEAYTLFLQAREISFLESDQFKVKLFQEVISLDPGYADAYAAMAQIWVNRGGHAGSFTREEILNNATPLITKALELDSNAVNGHVMAAIVKLYYHWDFIGVEGEYWKMRQLNPSNPDNNFLTDYLLATGRFQEAFELAKSNFDRNKNSFYNWAQLGLTYFHIGQSDKALETLKTAANLFEHNGFIWLGRIRLHVNLENYEDAVSLYEDDSFKNLGQYSTSWTLGDIGVAYFKTGNKEKSKIILNELLSRSKSTHTGSPCFFAAAIYTAMGDKDKAFEFLEKGYTGHEVEMYWLMVDPLFKLLHDDPRFEVLLDKIGFKKGKIEK